MSLERIPGVPGISGLDEQRALVKRARRDAWHWIFRAVLLTIISALSFVRHWLMFGVLFAALALMAVQLARVTQRRAAELVAKIKLLEGK